MYIYMCCVIANEEKKYKFQKDQDGVRGSCVYILHELRNISTHRYLPSFDHSKLDILVDGKTLHQTTWVQFDLPDGSYDVGRQPEMTNRRWIEGEVTIGTQDGQVEVTTRCTTTLLITNDATTRTMSMMKESSHRSVLVSNRTNRAV
jgi:hypothetical protein